MGNAKRARISFESGNETHTLALTTNAMCRYQEKAGETLVAGLQALQKESSDIVRIRRLFWAGLAECSEDEAGDLIDDIGLNRAAELLGEAAVLAFPQDDAGADAGKGKAARPPKSKA